MACPKKSNAYIRQNARSRQTHNIWLGMLLDSIHQHGKQYLGNLLLDEKDQMVDLLVKPIEKKDCLIWEATQEMMTWVNQHCRVKLQKGPHMLLQHKSDQEMAMLLQTSGQAASSPPCEADFSVLASSDSDAWTSRIVSCSLLFLKGKRRRRRRRRIQSSRSWSNRSSWSCVWRGERSSGASEKSLWHEMKSTALVSRNSPP